jgi:hypothetical protein
MTTPYTGSAATWYRFVAGLKRGAGRGRWSASRGCPGSFSIQSGFNFQPRDRDRYGRTVAARTIAGQALKAACTKLEKDAKGAQRCALRGLQQIEQAIGAVHLEAHPQSAEAL